MSFNIVSNPSQSASLQERLFAELNEAATTTVSCAISFRPTIMDANVHWSENLGLWWYSKRKNNRWWNVFGLECPHPGDKLQITCEINIPALGIDRNIAGAFATDGKRAKLVHRGNRYGGGITGATKEFFWANYEGRAMWVVDGNQENKVAIVGEFGGPELPASLSGFVREFRRIKSLIHDT